MNDDDAGSRSLRKSHSHDIGLYKETMGELPILMRETRNFRKNRGKPATFHAPPFYTSKKTFLSELRAVFADHCTDSASDITQFLNTAMSRTLTARIHLVQIN